jgi:hypothetical protein
MKLSYATPAATPSYTVLGDESDRSALFENFSPSFQPLNQVEPLAGGSNTFKTPRGNVAVSVNVTVSIPYASRAAALASIATLRTAFSVKKHLKVEQDATIHYYPNALLTGYQPVLKGITVSHSFGFTSDDVTTSAPTT